MKILRLNNLSKNFGGLKAVDNCSFDVNQGEITTLMGPNGSGKSTILNLISGIFNPDSGEIIFDDTDITNLPIEKISNLGISRTFQQSRLFENLTIKENLLLAINSDDTKFWKNLISFNKVEKMEEITKILEKIEMQQFEEKLSRYLSYGQKRLIELGKAILNPYKLLILDEPAAGIGHKLKEKMAELILYLKNSGKTIFFIEHDIDFTLKIADNIILMDEGKIVSLYKNKYKNIKINLV